MPLKFVNTPHYIRRTRVFVDSAQRNTLRSRGPFDYTFDVDEEIQNVVAIELVGWNFNSLYASTFLGRYNTTAPTSAGDIVRSVTPALHTFDILIEDENSVESIILQADMEQIVPTLIPISQALYALNDRTDVRSITGLYFQFVFVFLFLNSGLTITPIDTTMRIEESSTGQLEMMFFRTAGPFEPMPSFFMFKSGPTADDNAGKSLGFIETTDTTLPALTTTTGIGSGTNYVATSEFLINQQPLRYVDVTVKEVEEDFTPLARVYLNRITDVNEYIRPSNEGMNTRLLTNPVRRLDRLSINVTIGDNYRLSENIPQSHQLTFDVLSIAQIPSVPTWLSQRLLL